MIFSFREKISPYSSKIKTAAQRSFLAFSQQAAPVVACLLLGALTVSAQGNTPNDQIVRDNVQWIMSLVLFVFDGAAFLGILIGGIMTYLSDNKRQGINRIVTAVIVTLGVNVLLIFMKAILPTQVN